MGCLQHLWTVQFAVFRLNRLGKKAQENPTNELAVSSEGGGGITLTSESTRYGLMQSLAALSVPWIQGTHRSHVHVVRVDAEECAGGGSCTAGGGHN